MEVLALPPSSRNITIILRTLTDKTLNVVVIPADSIEVKTKIRDIDNSTRYAEIDFRRRVALKTKDSIGDGSTLHLIIKYVLERGKC